MSVTIRRLEPQDLDFTCEMLLAEKWNDRREDAERMLNYDSEGCFITEVNNKPAGHIFSIRYGKLAWIGYLIVTPEQRQKGIATGLMKTTLHYLNDKNVQTIKLEAIPEISELYRRFGFKKEYDSLRFTGNPQHKKLTEDNSIQPLRPRQITETARFDAEYFGENRMKVLSKLCSEYPDKCFIALNEKTIEGYVMCRRAVSGYKIGPWVCSPRRPESAKELLTTCICSTEPNSEISIGAPFPNRAARQILEDYGFKQTSKSVRMRLGKPIRDGIEGIFAIGGPMKG